MCDVNTLNPGDKIVIVDKWVPGPNDRQRWNSEGKMDKYLGSTMTVARVGTGVSGSCFVKVYEDNSEWFWYPEMIADVLADEDNAIFDPAESGDIAALFA